MNKKRSSLFLALILTMTLSSSCDQETLRGFSNKVVTGSKNIWGRLTNKDRKHIAQGNIETVISDSTDAVGGNKDHCPPTEKVDNEIPSAAPNYTPRTPVSEMFAGYAQNPKVRNAIDTAKANVGVCKRNSRIASRCNKNCKNGYCEKDPTRSMGQCSLFFAHAICGDKYPFNKGKGSACSNGLTSKRVGVISGGMQGNNLRAQGWLDLKKIPGFKEMNLNRNDAPPGAVITYLDPAKRAKGRVPGNYVGYHGHVDLVGDNKFYSDFTTPRGTNFSIPTKGIFINPKLVTDKDLEKWPPKARDYFRQKMKR